MFYLGFPLEVLFHCFRFWGRRFICSLLYLLQLMFYILIPIAWLMIRQHFSASPFTCSTLHKVNTSVKPTPR